MLCKNCKCTVMLDIAQVVGFAAECIGNDKVKTELVLEKCCYLCGYALRWAKLLATLELDHLTRDNADGSPNIGFVTTHLNCFMMKGATSGYLILVTMQFVCLGCKIRWVQQWEPFIADVDFTTDSQYLTGESNPKMIEEINNAWLN